MSIVFLSEKTLLIIFIFFENFTVIKNVPGPSALSRAPNCNLTTEYFHHKITLMLCYTSLGDTQYYPDGVLL